MSVNDKQNVSTEAGTKADTTSVIEVVIIMAAIIFTAVGVTSFFSALVDLRDRHDTGVRFYAFSAGVMLSICAILLVGLNHVSRKRR